MGRYTALYFNNSSFNEIKKKNASNRTNNRTYNRTLETNQMETNLLILHIEKLQTLDRTQLN